jgi:hypothetical protein
MRLPDIRTTAVVITAGIALSACAESSNQPYPSPDLQRQEIVQLPRPACEDADQEISLESANRCRAAQENGRIALISYGIDISLTKPGAEGIAKALHTASSGILKSTVTVIEASPDAKEALAESIEAKGCINSYADEQLASSIADANMPELQKSYDFVLAISNERACAFSVAGRADGMPGRHADLFMKAETHEGIITLSLKDVISNGSHELGHGFGQRHNSRLTRWSDTGDRFQNLDEAIDASPAGLDIRAYLADPAKYIYSEYNREENALMGNGTINLDKPDTLRLSSPEINRLMRSSTPGKGPLLDRPLSSRWETFNSVETRANHYATLDMAEPIILEPPKDPKNKQSSDARKEKFSRVAVLPLTGEKGTPFESTVNRARIYLLGSSGKTLNLGDAVTLGQNETTKIGLIKVDDQIIEIKLVNKIMQTRVVK